MQRIGEVGERGGEVGGGGLEMAERGEGVRGGGWEGGEGGLQEGKEGVDGGGVGGRGQWGEERVGEGVEEAGLVREVGC